MVYWTPVKSSVFFQRKFVWAQGQQCTVPSTIGEELETNPFMRTSEPTVQQAVASSDPIQVMAALREAKNSFHG